ncbi:MAG: hypothetical protein L3J81_04175, partial [Thermoplasmata archaeon]|nr:hypothetical protein [Thermoplasmata archaeon]
TYQDTPGHLVALALSALHGDVAYAWHNSVVPRLLPTGSAWSMSLRWNDTTASAILSAGNVSTSTSIGFGDASVDAVNPGFNRSAVPSGPVEITKATETVSMVGAALCLHATSVAQLPDVSYLVAESPAGPSSNGSIGTTGSVTASGDVLVPSGSARFVVLGYPYDPLWTASVAGTGGVTSVDGAPFDNVFEVAGGGNGSVVTLHFRTWILVGLEASWVEVVVLIALGVVLTIRGRRAGHPEPPEPATSTIGGPDPETLPGHTP